jgi:isochorismate synthase
MTARIEATPVTGTALESLLRRAASVAANGDSAGRPILVSLSEPISWHDPLAFFSRVRLAMRDGFYWEQPAEGFALSGAGAAHVIAPKGKDRFVRAAAEWRGLIAGALIEGGPGDIPGVGPLLTGGFSFDPERPRSPLWREFPDSRLVLPRFLLTRASDACWLTTSAVVSADDDPEALAAAIAGEWTELFGDGGEPSPLTPLPTFGRGEYSPRISPPPELGEGFGAWGPSDALPLTLEENLPAADWQAIVADGVDAVRGGALEKVVLARQVSIRSDLPFDVTSALQRLRASYPTCYVFAVARGDQVFLGATPERLARLRDREVRVACLAGSRERGMTPEEDRRLGDDLLDSTKNRSEHAVVVHALRQALAPVCSEVSAPDEPVLLSVRNVHHLYTPVTGRLANGACMLDIVARLHPTPAVGGFPSRDALRFIREREDLDRGWYAAPVGWVDHHGEGEFAVALRSALIGGAEAALFAGCGVMGDSDPVEEYAESWLKLRPVLSALGSREP